MSGDFRCMQRVSSRFTASIFCMVRSVQSPRANRQHWYMPSWKGSLHPGELEYLRAKRAVCGGRERGELGGLLLLLWGLLWEIMIMPIS